MLLRNDGAADDDDDDDDDVSKLFGFLEGCVKSRISAVCLPMIHLLTEVHKDGDRNKKKIRQDLCCSGDGRGKDIRETSLLRIHIPIDIALLHNDTIPLTG